MFLVSLQKLDFNKRKKRKSHNKRKHLNKKSLLCSRKKNKLANKRKYKSSVKTHLHLVSRKKQIAQFKENNKKIFQKELL